MEKKLPGAVIRNRTVFTALFAALIAVTCLIAIPAGPLGVPIVMQNIMAVLAGAILGGLNGAAAVFLFLLAGILGLPVFSGGASGFVRMLGPTGGFLTGYFFAALLTGLILGIPSVLEKRTFFYAIKITLAGIAGIAVIYVLGIPWLAKVIMTGKSISFVEALPAALAAGMLPFLPGELVKLIIFVPLTIALRPIAARYINSEA